MKKNPNADLQEFQRLDKYARFMPEVGRRETWEETVSARIIPFFRDYKNFTLDKETWDELEAGLLAQEATPSMRVVQMAGPALMKCEVGAYNCASVVLDSIQSFCELFYVLMQGAGCSFSVEREFISQLPEVAKLGKTKKRNDEAVEIQVQDDTESWCDSLGMVMHLAFQGQTYILDVSKVRQRGARLVTKGGFASGPEPLVNLLSFVYATIREAAGRQLTSFECHRIACKIAEVGEVGGVRRSATLSHSDLDDDVMREAKNGQFWETYPELAQANNSAVFTGPFDAATFDIEWSNLRTSGTGERGIVRRDSPIPERRQPLKHKMTNPCGEVDFDPYNFCNLSLAVIRPTDNKKDIARKVRLATIWGTLQSALTNFSYLRPIWRENVERERLLGVDIPGADSNRLFDNDAYKAHVRDYVIQVNREFAAKLGINPSVATTVIKPGGNSGVFLNVGHPVNGWPAKYMIRRVRVGTDTAMFRFLQANQVPHDFDNEKTAVFEFPRAAPDGAIIGTMMSALSQLNRWLSFKCNWTEHNPSVTIYVADHEWDEVRVWIEQHWEWIGGLSFFPKSDHVYPRAPIEAVDEVQYQKLVDAFPNLDWSLFYQYEEGDATDLGRDYACFAGVCTI